MQSYWLSSEKMTVLVDVKDNTIVIAPPIVRKFLGQPIKSLINWMEKQGGLKVKKVKFGE